MSTHDEINDRAARRLLAYAQIAELRKLAQPIASEAWSAENDAVRTIEGVAACWAATGADGLAYVRRNWIAATGPAELLPLLELLDEFLSAGDVSS